ncbi:MAG: energy-coupling factor ABC transporter ATP-binding protein [Christensenellaceae bacterium]|nr:energy-coupling factor ABC transporter ATP-binding protein [Christensenellaceae bacterium]
MEKIRIENLTFAYPNSETNALNNIDLTVNEGEFMLICGRSGCGKSTLLRHMKSILTPYGKRSGEVYLSGKKLSEYSQREQASEIGFVMQNPDDQIVTDKVWHELAFGLENLGCDQAVMRLRIGEMASYFGIQNWFYKNVTELSGGQKQLLNLASVMAMNPQILILDEPTSQLDPISASEFLNTVKRLNDELGITVIMTEHRLEEAFKLADSAVVMENGEIIIGGCPEKVAKTVNVDSDVFKSLPASAKIFRRISNDDSAECPLTVKGGVSFLKKLELQKKLLKHSELKQKNEKPAIELDECFFKYDKNGSDVLKGVSIKAYRGEIYCLVGGNGAGKSTALSVMSGLNVPYRGRVLINGRPVKRFNAREQKIGALGQDPTTLFVKKTVLDDLKMMVGKADNGLLKKVIELMEIEKLISSHPFDLSGGEQQRVAIAKILLTEPEIMLLDEPTKGMDSAFKDKFGETLRRMADSGTAVIIVSHDIEFAAKYSDRCGLFFDGGVISENAPREFFSGNRFYTTSANRIAGFLFKNAVLTDEVISLCAEQLRDR